MPNLELILTLTGGLAVALVLGYITQRCGLSPIVGYILAGIAVGPHTPGFVADSHLAEQLAEVGVILLMFGVGLQFHLKELLAVRNVAIPGAVVQSLVATILGVFLVRAFGWSWSAGVIFGLSISVASTVVLLRVLADNRDLHTPVGHIAVGWLVVEDIFTVVVLVLLPALFGAEVALDRIPLVVGLALVKVSVLVAFIFLVGGRVIPWVLGVVAASRSRELFTLTVLVLALGIAVGSAMVFGVSMALGAFLAGMVVGRSDFSYRAASEALPMRDAFAVLFFVSVGMLLDPQHLIEAPVLILATLGIVLIGKPLAALVIVLALRRPLGTALGVAVALAQIGEFSFILANMGKQLEILSAEGMNTLVAAAIVSISLNPLLYRLVDPAERWLLRWPALRAWLEKRTARVDGGHSEKEHGEHELSPQHRAVVVGYGPVGRTVARLLQENDVQPTIVDLNLAAIQSLQKQNIRATYGDATRRETLQGAGVEEAGTLILSASGSAGSAEVIRQARELNPEIHVLARTSYLAEADKLKHAGADSVFSGEGEVALAFTVAVLRRLGATAEQIDRERERVYEELFGKPPPAAPSAEELPTLAAPPVAEEAKSA